MYPFPIAKGAMAVELTTRVLKSDREAIAAAARVLGQGGLVAFPTETVYGLGADATNGEAIARLYAAKGRPRFNPLIAHVSDLNAALRLARFSTDATLLAGLFWPGPLTLVLPKAGGCPVAELATAGLDTIGVRVPDHPVAHDLLAAFGKPIVAPSANQSGHVSPTAAQHVLADLGGRIDLIVDRVMSRCAHFATPRRPAARDDRARAWARVVASAGYRRRRTHRPRDAPLALRAAGAHAAQY
jgi:L-threonylcarbamoyladenylate synthase